MNNYFANYKCWNDKKQRVAVFGKETGSGTIKIFELYCNKDDQFSKKLAKTIYNNPYKLNLWYANDYEQYRIDYNPTDAYNVGWVGPDVNLSTFTFTSISGLPPLSPPFYNMRSLFTNNAQVYYKSHSLSTGGGGSGVRNSSHKKHRT